MRELIIRFPSGSAANQLVAGLPFAARCVHHLVEIGKVDADIRCVLAVKGGWLASPLCEAELRRLAPGIEWVSVSTTDIADQADCVDPLHLMNASAELPANNRSLALIGRKIISATAKSTDGYVSRHLNRPVSQWISRHALRLPFIRPIHMTMVVAILAIAMAFCLLFGGYWGLIAGAILYQAASIIDGCDGEIARATFRSSRIGATLDTATDMATNFVFIGGLCLNLYQQGLFTAALAGAAGLGAMFCGLALLGLRALQGGEPLSFDSAKSQAYAAGSPVLTFLGKATSRDSYALFLAVLTIAGFASQALIIFAIVATGWLCVIVYRLLAGKPLYK